MQIEALFDPRTFTLTYLVWDEATRDAVVIDPVLDYDPVRVRVYEESLSRLEARIAALGLTLRHVLETHAHADHLSGGDRLRRRHKVHVGIGAAIVQVQRRFADMLELGADFPVDGRQFDHLFQDGEVVRFGALEMEVIATPGHTPACVCYRFGDAVFTGDALFMPDQGTGRCDFPDGSAELLYRSLRRLYALPDDTRVFVGHDYQPGGRELRYESTIGAEKAANIQLRDTTTAEEFVQFRTTRDRTLNLPTLLLPAIQVNITAGAVVRSPDGRRPFLKMPINVFDTDPV